MTSKIGEALNKEPTKHGNGAIVYVPKSWIGYVVRVEVTGKQK